MPHAPFIILAYVIAALVLGWCAIAPVVRGRRVARRLRNRTSTGEAERASET